MSKSRAPFNKARQSGTRSPPLRFALGAKYMNYELLHDRHVELLLKFETDNRNWFESLIASRGSDFYSREAVMAHIEEYRSLYEKNELLPIVIVERGQIIARANLKNVCVPLSSAEVGYRVAQSHSGSGVGTYCLSELIRVSKLKYGQLTLRAKVLENNPASRRILEKHGFSELSCELEFMKIGGSRLRCTTMERAGCA